MTGFVAIDHVQLAMPPGSEETAAAFYEGVLGIPRVPKPEPLASRGGCWFEAGPVRIHLGVEDDFRPAHKAHPALAVADLAAFVASVTAAGIAVTPGDTINGVERVYVDDPFGNRIEIVAAS